MKALLLVALAVLAALSPALDADVVEYDLTVSETRWAPKGHKPTRAITVNNGIPGPTIRFKVGDTARIRVHNKLQKEDTSIHWHGLLLPNGQDGVPYVTTPPIKPGTTHTFEFPILHAGTYWYHSHTGFQEQTGVFGSIVVDPVKPDPVPFDREHVVVLSDWSKEKAEEIMRSLARGTEWYEIKKKTAQSVVGAIKAGAFREFWQREYSRMLPMDVSDIAYDAFLANGSESLGLTGKPGERIKLRFINASAATYFYLQSSTGPLKIVAADGPNVVPIKVKRLFIGMAETYDVIVTVPPSGKWEVRATAQDGSGHASVWLGNGQTHAAPDVPKPDTYRMDSHLLAALNQAAEEHLGDEEALAREPERPLSPYQRLRAPHSTAIPAHLPRRTITLRATGDMERYVWSFDNKTFAEDGVIPIKKGEVIRLVMINDTMMHHPLHLHGAFFRLLMGNGTHSPLKHTIDLPPMAKRIIEFEAKEKGDWLFHCHLLYHMNAGMTRIFSYQDDSWVPPPSDPEGGEAIAKHHAARKQKIGGTDGFTHVPHGGGHEADPLYILADASFLSSYTMGTVALINSRNDWFVTWEAGFDDWKDAEFDLGWRRYMDANRGYRFGLRYSEDQKSRVSAFAGYDYRLPYLIWSRVEVNTSGSARVILEKELPITARLSAFAALEYDTREAWRTRFGGRFSLTKYTNLVLEHHSDYGPGVGLGITY